MLRCDRRWYGVSGSRCNARSFVEVETPMLQVMHGGANARPFVTHINAYDLALPADRPELYLKRLLVGGVEKVFEINRNFRNEGADSTHNPEFTMLEMYEAYGDYNSMRILTRSSSRRQRARSTAHRRRHTEAEGTVEEYDCRGDWPVKTMSGALRGARRGGHARHPLEEAAEACTRSAWMPTPDAAPGRSSWRSCTAPRSRAQTTTPGLLQGLPQEQRSADPRAPRRPAADREVGPGCVGRRARHRVLRAHRPS